ncbi:MAG: hypothetical protein ACRDJH_23420 [Thermomicrobiales bacterium]
MRYVDQLMEELEARLRNEPRIQDAVTEMQSLIRARYPQAKFEVGFGEEPIGLYITATIDIEDLDEVDDAYWERLRDLQLREGLPVYVLVVRPLERTMETPRQRQKTAHSA